MTFPRFFIDRPIFAIVLSVLMVIAGVVAFFQLPLSEYPSVTPPTVPVRVKRRLTPVKLLKPLRMSSSDMPSSFATTMAAVEFIAL